MIALQEARSAAGARYVAIAAQIAQQCGVASWCYCQGLRGRAWPTRAHIEAPEPTTRRRLHIWAHECAHVRRGSRKGLPVWLDEYETELEAMALMRLHGVAVPQASLARAKAYVASKIRQARRRGLKAQPPAAVLRWCGLA